MRLAYLDDHKPLRQLCSTVGHGGALCLLRKITEAEPHTELFVDT